MNQAIVDINEKTFKKGDVLTRPGKTATIIEPAIHRTSHKFIGYYVDLLTDGESPIPQRITLFTANLRDWTLQSPVKSEVAFPIGIPFEMGSNGEPVPEAVPDEDEELTATAALIKQLREEIEVLEAENERLVDSRDSAIEHDAAIDGRIIELTDQVEDLKSDCITYQVRIKNLTEQLAEARLASAPIQSAPAADATSLRCEEVKTLHQKMGSPSAREDADRELAAHLNSGWQKFDCSYVLGDMSSFRFVTLTRIITPAPVAPEPRASFTVKPVGNMVTIIPNETAPAARVSFNAEEYLANMLDDCQKAAEEAIADQLPAYQAILNPRPLALGVGNPVKPEVR